MPFSLSQYHLGGLGATLFAATENLQNESAELSEKMRLALAAQQLLLDKRRILLDERRRQLAVGRSLIASCRTLISTERWDGALVGLRDLERAD